MRILITGVTGFVGQRLAQALLARGCAVTGLSRRRPADPRIAHIAADFGHDTEIAPWMARLHGIDVVVNTVGIIRETDTQRFAQLHTAAPRALFAACAAQGVGKVVQLSALGADEAATTAYHLSKKAADDFLAGLPLRSRIVQPSLIDLDISANSGVTYRRRAYQRLGASNRSELVRQLLRYAGGLPKSGAVIQAGPASAAR